MFLEQVGAGEIPSTKNGSAAGGALGKGRAVVVDIAEGVERNRSLVTYAEPI